MAVVRIPRILRHMTAFASVARVSHQRRWAQVHDVRYLATAQDSSTRAAAVLGRYRDKLQSKAIAEGHDGDVEALRKAYATRIDEMRRKAAKIEGATEATTAKAVAGGPRTTTSSSGRSLDAILDMTKARQLPAAELGAVWRLRHASDPHSLCAVVPAATYAAMSHVAQECPQFVLPVPRGGGSGEMHFLQWTWDGEKTGSATVLFTHLAEYKLRGEFAQPHTIITHHVELADEKGIVLMGGTVARGRGVSPDDARWLVMCLQRFYGGWHDEGAERADERRKLLQWFAKGDARFSVEKLMDEAERLE